MAKPPDSSNEDNIPTSNPTTENGIHEDNECEFEKCIAADYRRSIIIYPHETKASRKGWKKYFGAFCAILTGILVSILGLIFTILTLKYKVHPLTISLWRSIGSLPITTALLLFFFCWKGKSVLFNVCPIWERRTWVLNVFLAVNGILSWTYVVLRTWSLKYLSMPDSAVIVFSSPILVVILAHFFLKEKCGIISMLTALIALGGVILISRPPFITGQAEVEPGILIGVAIALSAMVSQSIMAIVMRKIRQVHFSVVIFLHSCYISLLSVLAAGMFGVLQLPKDKDEWILAFLTIISAFLISLTLTFAYKYEEAGRVTLIMCLEIALSYLWQYIFLDTRPDVYSLLGSCVLISAVCITLARKWLGRET